KYLCKYLYKYLVGLKMGGGGILNDNKKYKI
ncbi:hypothetical protein cje21_06719, partial [Campylobacter jejuni subsp. jejuni 1997-7]